jgi:hypothetical protein
MKKPIGRFIQNLGRAGVTVEDWTCNLEWHDDGTPHFHLLVQVSKVGRSGQIGEKLIHECWPYGRIHEHFFKSEKAFLNFLGYFGKTGYLHKNKQHQVTIPAWAADEHWCGKKINRFSSMKHPALEKEVKSKSNLSEAEQLEESEQMQGRTYSERISGCGQETNFWIVTPGQPDKFIRRVSVPYREVLRLAAGSGQFIAGLGFVFDAPPWLILQEFCRYTVAYSSSWRGAA